MKRINDQATLYSGRMLTVAQLAIVLAPYIVRPTNREGASIDVADIGDALIEPSKCFDSPKPMGFPLTPRRRGIVRSDWAHITELIEEMVSCYDALFHHNREKIRAHSIGGEKVSSSLATSPSSSCSSASHSAWVPAAKRLVAKTCPHPLGSDINRD